MNDVIFEARQVSSLRRGRFGKKGFRLEEISFQLPRGYIHGADWKERRGQDDIFRLHYE